MNNSNEHVCHIVHVDLNMGNILQNGSPTSEYWPEKCKSKSIALNLCLGAFLKPDTKQQFIGGDTLVLKGLRNFSLASVS